MKKITQCAVLTVSTIAAQILFPDSGSMAGIAAAGAVFKSILSVLENLVANRFQKDEDSKQALQNTLHNEHLARAAADAICQTLISAGKDKNTTKLAERARSYWLHLQASEAKDSRFASYAEKELPARIIGYVTDTASANPIPESTWKDFLIEAASSGVPTIPVEENRLNELASSLNRGYPERLYNTFKTDISNDGPAFGGMVLSLLGKISIDLNNVQRSNEFSEEETRQLFTISDRISEGVLRQAALSDKLDEKTKEILAEVRSSQIRLHEKLEVIRQESRQGFEVTQEETRKGFAVTQEESRQGFKNAVNEITNVIIQGFDRLAVVASGKPDASSPLLSQIPTASNAGGGPFKELSFEQMADEMVARKCGFPSLDALQNYLMKASDSGDLSPEQRVRTKIAGGDYTNGEKNALELANSSQANAVQMFGLAVTAAIKAYHFKDALAHAEQGLKVAASLHDPLLVATAQFNKANALYHLKRFDEAETLYRSALAQRNDCLGEKDPETIKVRKNLAEALHAEEKYVEAIEEFRRVVELNTAKLGRGHRDTLSARHSLAIALDDNAYHTGEFEESDKEHLKVATLREEYLGDRDPDTQRSRMSLARIACGNGDWPEGRKLYDTVNFYLETDPGPDDPLTLNCKFNLALVLDVLEKYDDARRAALAAEEGYKRLGRDDDAKDAKELREELEKRIACEQALGLVEQQKKESKT